MINIACLGWGSLIWKPGDLPIRGGWLKDGPLVPVEFARESKGNRITLVIVPTARPVQSLWALMDGDSLEQARDQLRIREDTASRHIHYWSRGRSCPAWNPELSRWAIARNVDAVIWTGLPPKFKKEDHRLPSVEEVIGYLANLSGTARMDAEEYVRRAPGQVDTEYRRRIEAELLWVATEGNQQAER